MWRFVFQNQEMLHFWIRCKKLCRQFGKRTHRVSRKRESMYGPCRIFSNSLLGDFGFSTVQFEVLAVCLKQQRTHTQLHWLSSLYTGYTHKVQTKARSYTCKMCLTETACCNLVSLHNPPVQRELMIGYYGSIPNMAHPQKCLRLYINTVSLTATVLTLSCFLVCN